MVGVERDRTLESLVRPPRGRRADAVTSQRVLASRPSEAWISASSGSSCERLVEQGLRLRDHDVRLESPEIGVQDHQACRSGPNRPWRTSGRARSPARRARVLAAGSPAYAGRGSAGPRDTGCRPAGSRSGPSRCAPSRRCQRRLELVRDRRRDLGLDRKQIVGAQPAIVGVGPEVLVGHGIDELDVDPHVVTGALDCAFEYRGDRELLADLRAGSSSCRGTPSRRCVRSP